MFRRVIPAFALLLLTASAAAAQFPSGVVPGVRVRVAVPDTARQSPLVPRQQLLFGTVVRATADSLHLALPGLGGVVAVPHGQLRALSVSRGVPSRGQSAVREGVRWAVLGALVFAVSDTRDAAVGRNARERAAYGAGFGLGVGAIVGAVWPSERWRRLSLRD